LECRQKLGVGILGERGWLGKKGIGNQAGTPKSGGKKGKKTSSG